MEILLTGANGFIGKNILEGLGNGHTIHCVSRNSNINILDINSLLKISKIDLVIHCAAKTFIPDSFKEPFQFYEFNFLSTLNIAEFCRIKKIKKLIYLNAYPYGVPQYLPIDESHPLEPHSPYNSSKIIAENLLFSYLKNITKVISLRVFNIYGKYQLQNFLIPNIISQIKESDKVTLNDLRPKRDFLYIQDLIILLNNIISDTKNIGIYNVGYGRSYSIKEVVDAISIVFNKKITLKTIQKKRQNEILDLYADINKVKSSFNWSPKFSILDGMKHYYKNEK